MTRTDLFKKRAQTRKFLSLQALRALAAALVVFTHALTSLSPKSAAFEAASARWSYLGDFGVKLFFCISGFIIFISSRSLAAGWRGAPHFLARRVVRIVPLYWCATALWALRLSARGQAPTARNLARSLFFVPYHNSVGLMRPVLRQGWTLNYEMFFYVLFAAAVLLPRRFQAVAVGGAICLLAAARNAGAIPPATAGLSYVFFAWCDPIVLFFLPGLFCAWAVEALDDAGRLPRLAPDAAFAAAAASLAGVVALRSMSLWSAYALAFPLACASCALVAGFECAPASKRFPALAALAAAGDASYSTYLTHFFFLGSAGRLLTFAGMGARPLTFSILTALICTVAGVVVHRAIERPLVGACRKVIGAPALADAREKPA